MSPETIRLIAITDDMHDGVEGLLRRAMGVVAGGATMVQLRLKHAHARTLLDVARALVRTLSVPVIINDRADIALASGAAGVHLGVDDLPVRAVRSIVPPSFIIGASLGRDDEIENARAADYAGIGSVYGTRSKHDAGIPIGLEGLTRLARAVDRPVVGIGGIAANNAAAVIRAGADGVAVLSALFGAEHPDRAARAIRSAIGR